MSFGFGVGDFIAVLDKAKLYRERFADAPDHFDSLSREIESLASILEYIGSIEEQLEDTEKEQLAPAIKESVKLLGELEKIHNENTSLDRLSSTTKLAALKPRAIWSRLDVQKLRLRISLNVSFLGAIKGFRDSEAIHATKQVVVSMHDEQTSRQRRDILDWVTTTDYASQQRDHLSRRHAGTNEWLLESEEFKSWLSEKSKTLLCPGMPGAGKTVMASTVVDELTRRFQDDADVGVTYIYCNFKDQERQNHHDLIASLAKQLAQSRSSMPSSLKEMYETHQRSRTPMSLQETVDLLQAIASSYRKLFIVIDALDECETKSRRTLLSEVFRLQQRQTTNILATTRQIPEIIESDHFKGSVSVQVSALDADVSRYISSRIPDMQSFVQKRTELQEEIKRGILENINGMFLMAKLLLESLSCKTNVKAIRKTLVAVTTEDDSYAYFYEEALERIRVQPPAHVELAHEVLSWIVFSRRPLKVLELQHALAFEEGEPEVDEYNISPAEMIISACAGLVTLDDDGGTIRLVHQTTQEFFNNRKANLFPDANAEIAGTCVRYLCLDKIRRLSRDSHWDIPPWRSPLFLKYATSKIFRNSFIPFYDYATLYWGDHAREAGEVPAGVQEFLSDQEMLKINVGILKELIGEQVPSTGAYLAAWFGLLKVFERHIFTACDVNFVDWKGQTAASWAIRRDHPSLVELLIEDDHAQSDMILSETYSCSRNDASQHSSDSALFYYALREAIERGHRLLISKLLAIGADRGYGVDKDNNSSLLEVCIRRGDTETLNLLLELDAESTCETKALPNAATKKGKGINIEKTNSVGRTPLAVASSIGLHEAVEMLLKQNAITEARDTYGRTPLFLATEQQHVSTVRLLLEYGADASIEDTSEQFPILLAAQHVNTSCLQILLRHGVNIEVQDKEKRTPLMVAVGNDSKSGVQLLLEYGANIKVQDKNQKTPLVVAVERMAATSKMTAGTGKAAAEGDLLPLAMSLLKYGSNTEAQNKLKETPLLIASKAGLTSTVRILLEHGADIESRDGDGRTPLNSAALNACGGAIEVLLKHGANIESRDRCGRAAFDNFLLSFQNSLNARPTLEEKGWSALLDHGADPTTRDEEGRTLLWWALKHGNFEAIQTVLSFTRELEAQDINGKYIFATSNYHRMPTRGRISQLLLNHISGLGSENNAVNGPRFPTTTEKASSFVRSQLGSSLEVAYDVDNDVEIMVRERNRLVAYLNSTDEDGLKILWNSPELCKDSTETLEVERKVMRGYPNKWFSMLSIAADHKDVYKQAIQVDDQELFNRLLVDETSRPKNAKGLQYVSRLGSATSDEELLMCALKYGRMSMLQSLVRIGMEIGTLCDIEGMNEALDRLMGQ